MTLLFSAMVDTLLHIVKLIFIALLPVPLRYLKNMVFEQTNGSFCGVENRWPPSLFLTFGNQKKSIHFIFAIHEGLMLTVLEYPWGNKTHTHLYQKRVPFAALQEQHLLGFPFLGRPIQPTTFVRVDIVDGFWYTTSVFFNHFLTPIRLFQGKWSNCAGFNAQKSFFQINVHVKSYARHTSSHSLL